MFNFWDNKFYLAVRRQGIKLYLNALYPYVLNHRAKTIGKKDKIEVVFFAIDVAMWHYQGIYDLLSQDKRFNCHVVLSPLCQFSQQQRIEVIDSLRAYFATQGIPYIDYDEENDKGFDVKSEINPDIVFYPQPYDGLYVKEHDFWQFRSKLLCYIPYAINVVKGYVDVYDTHYHNLAWKVYCPFDQDKARARKMAKNRGCNWVVSGYYNLDRYSSSTAVYEWKIKDKARKRLIWAPHFTITGDGTFLLPRSNFLWMAQLMLDIAQKYQDRLQIAFKPHPWLKSKLYNHPDWGKEKTDRYFELWATMDNTQVETGDFVDLFKTSDAMIHDSGSFTAEYLFVNKPVAFVTTNLEALKSDHSDFGCAALDQHYIVKNEADVLAFVNDVVLGGNDPMKKQRTSFFESVLRPHSSGSTSQFIVDDMKRSLGIR
jgi:hypothetical protein